MTTVQDIYRALDQRAPFSIQESWDNSGFLVGDPQAPVERVLTALDITDQVIREAEALGAQLIVSHHPLIFQPVKRMTLEPEDLVGRKLWQLARQGCAAICCHTNLDGAEGGVNSVLAQALGLNQIEQLAQEGVDVQGRPYGIGRVGTLPEPVALEDFLPRVQKALGPNSLRYTWGGKPVGRVAVGGGACGSLLLDAWKAGCDTFVTADLKYNHFLDAGELGLTVIDAGHFPTEQVAVPVLAAWLREDFPELEVTVSTAHREILQSFSPEK